MKIEIEITENGGFLVRSQSGKLWVAREYSLLTAIREAFGLEQPLKYNKRGESIPEKKSPKLKQTKKISIRGKK